MKFFTESSSIVSSEVSEDTEKKIRFDVNAETQLTLLRRVIDGFLSAVLVYFIYSYMHGIVKINNHDGRRESTIDDSYVLLISFLQ